MTKNSFNKRIGRELIALINNNASVIQIARWADSLYSNNCRKLDSETDDLITKISFMQHGPEFEIDRGDLEIIAKRLMKESIKSLNESMMKKLSFPDFEVEKMEFSLKEKILKIFVEGAWLDINEGIKLGKGILFFNEWESLSINRFNSSTKRWSMVDESSLEPLRDLCEVKFFDCTISLSGFGKKFGQWMEWKIVKATMHAEFES